MEAGRIGILHEKKKEQDKLLLAAAFGKAKLGHTGCFRPSAGRCERDRPETAQLQCFHHGGAGHPISLYFQAD
jgi:hypothetical protein